MNLRGTLWAGSFTSPKSLLCLLLVAAMAGSTAIAAVSRDSANTRRKKRSAITPTATRITSETFPRAKSFDPSLVALWRGEGDGQDAVGANHGTLMGGAGFTAGVSGQAFLLDGANDYVRIPDTASLHLSGEVTVEMWFKRQDSSSYGVLFDKRNWTTCNYGVIMSSDWGFQLYYNDPAIYDGNMFEISFSTVPAAGVFHHLAGTFRQTDSSHIELKTYIDGQLARTDVLRGNLANTFNGDALAIGSGRDGADGFFRGAIDEVALYSRALTALEIQSNYLALSTNVPPPPPPPPPPTNATSGLIALWHADGNAQDSVGNNHGTLQNGTAFTTGVSGQAFLLDGANDYIRVPDSSSLHLVGELTLEMWFKRQDSSSYGTLFDKRNWTTCNYGVIMSSDWGFQLYYNDPAINDGNLFEISFSQVPAPGVFHHLAGTFRQVDPEHVELKTYIDGQLARTDTRRGNLANTFNGDALAIGSARDGADGFFRGAIDEVALYGRALTALEIQSNYLALATNVPPPPPPPPPPTNSTGGIIALWHADGDAQDAIGSNHGSLMGGAGFTAGVSGQAFLLDGVNDFVRIPDNASLHLSGELTLEMWFKRQDSSSYGALFDKRNWTTCNYGVIMSSDWGLQLYYNDPAINDGNMFEISFSGVPAAGVFHHLAGTFQQVDSTHVMLKTYIDGQLVRTDTLRGNLANTFNGDALAIGSARDGASGFFRGAIDEVALYGRALSASEVLSNYVNVVAAPQIIKQPESLIVVIGDPASFEVQAAGAPPLSYQWRFNGDDLAGQTNSVLNIATSALSDAGGYSVVVANDSASVTSAVATLTVSETGLPPSIVSQPPASNSVPVGGTITLAVTVSGTPPFAYQWSFENVAIPGATNRLLVLSNAQPEDAGTYTMSVSNDYGSATSQPAAVIVTVSGSGGTLQFANLSSNFVYDVDGTNRVPAGIGYVAAISVGATPNALTTLGSPAAFVVDGRFLGGLRTVPFMTPGSTAYAQVRVWDSTVSSSYEEAVALGAKHGTSAVFQVHLGGGIILPGSLNLMQSFALQAGTGLKGHRTLQVSSVPTSLFQFNRTGSEASFVLTGPAGVAYAIETSTDLQHWTVVGYVLNNSGALRFVDRNVANGSRFYRARITGP